MPPISEMAELRHAILEDWRGSLIYFSARVTYNETDSDNESRRVSMKGKMLVKQTMAVFFACIVRQTDFRKGKCRGYAGSGFL